MDLSKMTARARHYVTADGKPGGAPHQQLVTDADGNALWEDRTHYAEGGVRTILSECTVGEADPSAMTTPLAEPLVEGKQYKVTYNGAEYNTTAKNVEIDPGVFVVCLGNIGAFGGENTGEPFLFAEAPAEMIAETGMYWMVQALDGAPSATVKVEIDDETVKKIDDKFIDLTAKRVYTDAVVGSDSTYAHIYRDPELTDELSFAEAYEILVKYGGKICAQRDTMTLEEYHLFTPMLVTPLSLQKRFYVVLADGTKMQQFTLYCADTVLD